MQSGHFMGKKSTALDRNHFHFYGHESFALLLSIFYNKTDQKQLKVQVPWKVSKTGHIVIQSQVP